MANQTINDTDNIKNVVPSKWAKGACPPKWGDSLIWVDGEGWVDSETWED